MQKKRIFITVLYFSFLFGAYSSEIETPEKYFEEAYVQLAHQEYGKALENFSLFIELERDTKFPRQQKIASMHCYRAHCFEQLQLINQAIFENQQALEIYTSLNDSSQISVRLQRLGTLFYKEGKLEQSFYFINNAIVFFEKIKWITKLQNSYFQLGEVNFKLGKLQEARENFEKSLVINKEFMRASENTYLEPETWFYLAKIAFAENRINESNVFLEKAEKKFKNYVKELPAYNNQLIDLMLLKSKQQSTQNKEVVISEILKAEVLARENNLFVASQKVQLAKAEYFDRTGNFGEAKKCYDSIFEDREILNQIKVINSFYLEYLIARSNHYEMMFSENADTALLIKELKLLEDFSSDLEKERMRYSLLRDMAITGKKRKVIYDKTIKTALILSELTQNQEYIKKAFLYAEKFTQGLFSEIVSTELTSETSGDREKQIVKQAEIKFQINQLLSLLDEPENNTGEKQIELMQLMNQFEQMQTGKNAIQTNMRLENLLKNLQEVLTNDETYLKYYETEAEIFRFHITKNIFRFDIIEKTEEYVKAFNLFTTFVSTPGANTDLSKISEFTEAAYFLYKKLVPDFEHRLQNNILIIDWSGSNSKIIFEALLTAPVSPKNMNMKEFPFLIKERNIRYSGSVHLFAKKAIKQSDKFKINYVGFAPFSEKKSGRKQKLNSTGTEVKKLAKLTGGEKFTGKNATKKNLFNLTSPPAILHLATHAGNHTLHPQLAELYLNSGTNKQPEKLFFYEIVNSEWKNRLVILGACETSKGEHIANYGTVSLSNAFQVAGVESVIGASWPANDFVSSEITVSTIRNIQKRLETSEALRQAKIEFIENANDLFSHPYYWAVYTYQGPKQYIFLTKNKKVIWGYSLVVILILSGFYFLLKFLRQRKVLRRGINKT